MILGLPDPYQDPLVTSTDTGPDPAPDTQAKIVRKTLISMFCDLTFVFYQCSGSASVCFVPPGSASGSVIQRYGSEDA